MSKKKPHTVADEVAETGEIWSLLALNASSNARTFTTMAIVGFFAVSIIAILAFANYKKDTFIGFLSANRIMYGFSEGDGVFVSTDKRPDEAVINYGLRALSHQYNYDPTTIEKNISYLLNMYDYRIALKKKPLLEKLIRSAKNNDITQSLTIVDWELFQDSTSYTLTGTGKVSQSAALTVLGKPWKIKFGIRMSKVAPNEGRKLGLALIDIKDQKL